MDKSAIDSIDESHNDDKLYTDFSFVSDAAILADGVNEISAIASDDPAYNFDLDDFFPTLPDHIWTNAEPRTNDIRPRFLDGFSQKWTFFNNLLCDVLLCFSNLKSLLTLVLLLIQRSIYQ